MKKHLIKQTKQRIRKIGTKFLIGSILLSSWFNAFAQLPPATDKHGAEGSDQYESAFVDFKIKENATLQRIGQGLKIFIKDDTLINEIIEVCSRNSDAAMLVFPYYKPSEMLRQWLSANLPSHIGICYLKNLDKEDEKDPSSWIILYDPYKTTPEHLNELFARLKNIEDSLEGYSGKDRFVILSELVAIRNKLIKEYYRLKDENVDYSTMGATTAQVLGKTKYLEWKIYKASSGITFQNTDVSLSVSSTFKNNTYTYSDLVLGMERVDLWAGVEITNSDSLGKNYAGRVGFRYFLSERWAIGSTFILNPDVESIWQRWDLDLSFYTFEKNAYIRLGMMYHNQPEEVTHWKFEYMFRPSNKWSWFITLYNTDNPNGPSADNPETENWEFHWKLGIGINYYIKDK